MLSESQAGGSVTCPHIGAPAACADWRGDGALSWASTPGLSTDLQDVPKGTWLYLEEPEWTWLSEPSILSSNLLAD